MSNKTAPGPPKGNGDATKWSAEENLKLIFLIMQSENENLSVKGWKDIGDKAKSLFATKYTMRGAKGQFQKLRERYLADVLATSKNAGNAGEAAETTPQGQKRMADSLDGPDAGDGCTTKAKKVCVKKITKSDADLLGEEDSTSLKATPKRRAPRKPKAKTGDGDSDDVLRNTKTEPKEKPEGDSG
ncbi:hypothetical protein M426DRAFT_25755 [Hypoxylon sp. CI-4A]|nr:hypothetical protein M426DRAFT_25755 [Hypoxylon sp. CI-4A]